MATATPSHLNDKSAQSKFIGLLIAGEFFGHERLNDTTQQAVFQQAMEGARHRYGHALCICRKPHHKLQIRLREGKYHLAVWPEEGLHHDSNCIFFRDPDQAAAATPAAVLPLPIGKEQSASTRPIELTFSMARVNRPAEEARKQPAADQLTPHALLNLLWTEASLTRWHPKWERDWGRARYELMQAAERLSVNGQSLRRHLFIPRPYRENIKESLNREVEQFIASLAVTQGGEIKSGLVIAPLRRIAELSGGGKALHFRHMHKPIGINAATFDFINRKCRSALRRVPVTSDPADLKAPRPEGWIEVRQPEAIALLHVETTSRGGLWARSAWVMATHPNVFIPANNTDEVILIDALLDGEYQFNRNLFVEQPSMRNAPEWIIRHVLDPQGHPVPRAAIEIKSKGAAPEYEDARRALANRLAAQGVPVWTWTPSGKQVGRTVPPLPLQRRSDHLVGAAPGPAYPWDINSVSYAYGSGK